MCGLSPPSKSYGQKLPTSTFSMTSQRNGNFNGEYLRNKTQHIQPRTALETAKGPLHSTLSQNLPNVVYCPDKYNLHFYPRSVNSAICFIARLRRRRSANGTQPNFAKLYRAKSRWQMPQHVGVLPRTMGPKTPYFWSFFSKTSRHNSKWKAMLHRQ